jgi:hypothetical protein
MPSSGARGTYLHLHQQDDQLPEPNADEVKRVILEREYERLRDRVRNLEAVVRVATKTLSPYAVPPRTKR